MFQMLWRFVPKPGCSPRSGTGAAQAIDHYITFDEGETFADIFASAVDYLHGLIESGQTYDRDWCASVTDYDIVPGPTLGVPA